MGRPMSDPILITGGLGLIGSGLERDLRSLGTPARIFDLRGAPGSEAFGDVRDIETLRSRMPGCAGVVHLAGTSRVIWGERDPAACVTSNVGGTENVLKVAAEQPAGKRPWVIFASSREVYGRAPFLPVAEDCPLSPVNVYGRSKAAAEDLTRAAGEAGLTTAIIRFSNVFGSIVDHNDRVVPAFARAGATGSIMLVEGGGNTFDFTWRDDVCRGLVALCQLVADKSRRSPPPIHLVTGRGTTLGELAQMALEAGGGLACVEVAAARNFDVEHFRGDPRRAQQLLGWRAETSIELGVARLVEDFRREAQRSGGGAPLAAEPS